ncbi:MAG: NAD-dependent epimerase/dehydratase family protein [Bacteroidetes Order II. Incertae sedis bacterium]|nr:NAD-dependent epimerase/dehydratase family protein [Bacteroidetes Order II. bacterium]
MQTFLSNNLTFQRIIRMAADVLMLSFSIIAAFVLRLAFSKDETVVYNVQDWIKTAAALVAIALPVFMLSGFYTSGRFYQGKYKAITVLQAVALTYLIFTALTFFSGKLLWYSRSVLLVSWIFSSILLVGARLWSVVWKYVLRSEVSISKKRNPGQIKSIRNVLVIGGAGYVGSGLIPRLLEKGYNVKLLDIMMFGYEPIKSVRNHSNLQIIRADFRQIDKVVEAVHGVDAVIHLGGIVGDPACSLDEQLTIDVNLAATRMVAEIAKGYGVQRFIFASSCSVYGASDEVLNELSSLSPVSLYAKTKIASEKVLQQLSGPDFCPVILRFGTIYGFSGRTRFDLVTNLLTAKAVKEGKITVYGGDQWRPFIHVNDVAKAVFLALEADLSLVQNEIFNVGSDAQNMTLWQVGELIKKQVPSAELLDLGMDGDRRNYRVSFKKIAEVLNFKPDWTMEAGITQVLEALHVGAVKDYKNPMYSNVQFLKEHENSELFKQLEKDHDLKLLEVFSN